MIEQIEEKQRDCGRQNKLLGRTTKAKHRRKLSEEKRLQQKWLLGIK
jgi:hypothetical protein